MDQHTRQVKKQKTETSTMSLSLDISIEIQRLIFTFLDVPSLGKMVLVSQHFRTLARSDEYWSQPLENLIKNCFDNELSLDFPPFSSRNRDFAKLSERPQKSTEFAKWMRDWFHAYQGGLPPVPYTLENIYNTHSNCFFENEKVISSEYDSDYSEYEEDSHQEGWISRSKFETMTLEEKQALLKKANDSDYYDEICDHYFWNEVYFENNYGRCFLQETGLLENVVTHVPEHVRNLFSKDNFGNDHSSTDWVVSENDLPTKREYYAKLGQLLTEGKKSSEIDEIEMLEDRNRCAFCCGKILWHDCGYDGKSKLYVYADDNVPKIQLFHYLKYNPGPNAKGYPKPIWEEEIYNELSSKE
ncbi:predicted protein [Chaetoceros tenuissimus]|uniref:F-box domain-containing protein n=1 Tax=Chaetoceros tenuissimus TaxID=426638 RepID=A0AAD3D4D9_9STRA|nr:predicted protein [Chaetoceros tenuissimus]